MKLVFVSILMVSSLVVAALAADGFRHSDLVYPTPRTASSLYSNNCVSCHGRDGRSKTSKGRLNHARDISDGAWHEKVSDERIFNSIMNGKGKKMPAYGKKFSESEIDDLVAYVRRLKK